MMISKAIVEAIYSMQPPGRFLKKCTDTGQWRELTRREAADKAAQAMAYAVRTSRKVAKKQSSIPLLTTTSQPPPPPFIGDGLAGGSSSPETKAHHVPSANLASDWGAKWDTTDATSSGADHDNNGGREELVSRNSSRQQQLLRFQQTSRSATLPTTSAGAPTNRLAQMLMIARTQQEQQYYQQRQLSLQYLMSQQLSLGFHNGLPYRSHPSSQPLSAPSSSAQGMSLPPNNFLRQEYLSRGNYGADAQLSALLQRERNMLSNPNPMHSMMGYQQSIFGTDIAPSYEAQQMQQMQRRRAMMQHQLSSLTDTSVECIPSRRQSSQSLDLLQQAIYLQQKSPQDLPPPPVINSTSKAELSAQSTPSSTPQTQQGGDGKLKDTEDDQ